MKTMKTRYAYIYVCIHVLNGGGDAGNENEVYPYIRVFTVKEFDENDENEVYIYIRINAYVYVVEELEKDDEDRIYICI